MFLVLRKKRLWCCVLFCLDVGIFAYSTLRGLLTTLLGTEQPAPLLPLSIVSTLRVRLRLLLLTTTAVIFCFWAGVIR